MGETVNKNLGLAAICATFLCGTALAQDAKTTIANAEKALGNVKAITYSVTPVGLSPERSVTS